MFNDNIFPPTTIIEKVNKPNNTIQPDCANHILRNCFKVMDSEVKS